MSIHCQCYCFHARILILGADLRYEYRGLQKRVEMSKTLSRTQTMASKVVLWMFAFCIVGNFISGELLTLHELA